MEGAYICPLEYFTLFHIFAINKMKQVYIADEGGKSNTNSGRGSTTCFLPSPVTGVLSSPFLAVLKFKMNGIVNITILYKRSFFENNFPNDCIIN